MTREFRVQVRRGAQRLIREAWLRVVRSAGLRTLVPAALGMMSLLAVFSVFLTKAPPPVLVVGLSPIPPFMFWNAEGKAAGAIPDLLNVAAARAGTTLQWVEHRTGAESALLPGSGIDIFPVVEVRDGWRKRFHMTQPFARAETLLIRLADHADLPIATLGLNNRPRVGEWVRRKYPGVHTETSGPDYGLSGVCTGKLDAALVETPAFDAFLMNRPDPCKDARFQISVLSELDINYAIASTFQSSDAADLLRHKMAEMAREGTLDKIFQRYYPLAHYRSAETFAETQSEKSSRLFQWGAGALFALCALLWMAMQRLRRRARQAVEMAGLRTRFLASISHELRTPLNGVLGIASALSSTPLDRTQREYVGLIRSSGETLLRAVNEILDFSRLEAGKHSLSDAPVNLEGLVEEVVSILAPVAQEKDLELAWVVAPDVPTFIQTDETAVRQILMNLLGNSLKFTERGIVTLRISQARIDGDAALLRILVGDSGPGIPPGQEESIFDPFTRSDNANTQAVAGTGLGLSITKQLVLLLGGTISAANVKSGGCLFTVELPFSQTAEQPSLQSQCHSDYTLPAHALILTQRAITGDMLERRLRDAGCRVTRLSGVEAALRAAEAGDRWGLLVIDTQIEGDPIDVATQLRHAEANDSMPVILLCTGAQEADALSGRVPEGYAIFPKPFRSELFCSTLEELLRPPRGGASTAPVETEPCIASLDAIPCPSGLRELQRATQPWMTVPPGCIADGQGCEECVRDNTGSLVPCLAAILDSVVPRALVADDNPVNRKVVSAFLRTMGIPCDTVGDGGEALSRFRDGAYTWVIMDWHMPEMDGLTTIRLMRESEQRNYMPRTPIILCSAANERDGRLADSEGAFDAMLPKPISVKSLRRALIESSRRIQSLSAAAQPAP